MALDNNDKDTEISLDDKIHKAITSRISRLNLDELIGKAVESAIQRTSVAPKVVESTDVKVKDSRDDEIVKLRKEMADKEAASLAKIQAQQEKQALSALKAELKGKVIPDMDDMVAEWMFASKKMISVNDEGEAVMSIGEDKYPLVEGVKKFLGSKEAKRFIPAGEANKAVVKPILDRPAPSGSPLTAGSNVTHASVTNDILASLNAGF